MMNGCKEKWIATIVSLAVSFGLRSTSALSHHVAPIPGTTNALTLELYVKSSEECSGAHNDARLRLCAGITSRSSFAPLSQDGYEPISLQFST